MLAGPIKAWWDCWDSPDHKHYVKWREFLSQSLVEEGHLVYRPHEAWKGNWSESAQAVNDSAIYNVDVVINLTPPGVPSAGTDLEMHLCEYLNKPVIYAAPPPRSTSSIWTLSIKAREVAAGVSKIRGEV